MVTATDDSPNHPTNPSPNHDNAETSINSNNINNEATSPSATSPKSASASIANNDNNSNAISSPNDINAVTGNNANSGTPTPIIPRVLYGSGSKEDINNTLGIIKNDLQLFLQTDGDVNVFTKHVQVLLDLVNKIGDSLPVIYTEQKSNKRNRTIGSTLTQEENKSDIGDGMSHMLESIRVLQLYLNHKHEVVEKVSNDNNALTQQVVDLQKQLQKQNTKSDNTITELNQQIINLTSELAASGRSDVVVYEGEEMTDHEAACRELEGLSNKFETLNISHGLLKLSAANLQGQVARLNSDKSLLVDRERRSQAQLDRMKERGWNRHGTILHRWGRSWNLHGRRLHQRGGSLNRHGGRLHQRGTSWNRHGR